MKGPHVSGMKNPHIVIALLFMIGSIFCAAVEAYVVVHDGVSINIDVTSIGYPDNNDDHRSNYGGVIYEYEMAVHEVTIDQFTKVFEADNRVADGDENYWNSSVNDPLNIGTEAPASFVSWYEAAKFANWLTTGDAYIGAYQFDGNGVLTNVLTRNAIQSGSVLNETRVYLLPTEHEWHKAAYFKADGSGYTTYSTGNLVPEPGISTLAELNYAFQGGFHLGHPWAVDGKIENNGTYNMNGNVREWCESAHDGVLNPSTLNEMRVVRGGAFDDLRGDLQSEKGQNAIIRPSLAPDSEEGKTGFRVAVIQPSNVLKDTGTELLYRLDDKGNAIVVGGVSVSTIIFKSHRLEIPASFTEGAATYPVTAIGDNAFNARQYIKEVIAPSVLEIDSGAFSDCPALTSINFPAVTSVGDFAFSDCANLTTVALPAVTSIVLSSAFSNCNALASIDLSALENLPEGAFHPFRASLGSVTLRSAASVGEHFFEDFEKLTSVNLPETTNVASFAFSGCTNLQTVILPKALSIGNTAFQNCAALPSINLPEITSVPSFAFSGCTNLQTVMLPKTLSIGNTAFQNCAALPSINLPETTNVASFAFSGCTNLQTVKLPKVLFIGDSAFQDCSTLPSINLPEAGSIGRSAFLNCVNLRTVTLPKALSIEEGVFQNCETLPSINLPEITSVPSFALNRCTNLKTVMLPKALSIGEGVFQDCAALPSINLPETTNVASFAFNRCTNLRTVTLPKALSIGEGVFQDCETLHSINLPEVTSVPLLAFNECNNLQTVMLPKALSIGNTAFQDCAALSSINLPETTNVASSAFNQCAGLHTVKLPKVLFIGNSAFQDCRALPSIELPEAVSIENLAFSDCISLTDVTLPAVTSINLPSAFRNCTLIRSVDLSALRSISAKAIKDSFRSSIRHIKLSSLTSVPNQAFLFAGQLRSIVLSSATHIGDRAFDSCNKLESIYLPKARIIGVRAFEGCYGLKTAYLPLATTIRERAFADCPLLRTVFLPSVQSLGTQAFHSSYLPLVGDRIALETLFLGHFPGGGSFLSDNGSTFDVSQVTLYHNARDTEAFESTSPWREMNRVAVNAEFLSLEIDEDRRQHVLSYRKIDRSEFGYILMKSADLIDWVPFSGTNNSFSVEAQHRFNTDDPAAFYRVDTVVIP